MDLFDERNLVELQSPEYPGERLVACRNRALARLRAHILLCRLAYYVEWHMREAWRELMFADTEQAAKTRRDPVASAQRSEEALKKISTKQLEDGTKAHSAAPLMAGLASIVRNTCRTPGVENDASTFEITTTANAEQQRALELIRGIKM